MISSDNKLLGDNDPQFFYSIGIVVFEISETTVESKYTTAVGMFRNDVFEVNQETRDFEPGPQEGIS